MRVYILVIPSGIAYTASNRFTAPPLAAARND